MKKTIPANANDKKLITAVTLLRGLQEQFENALRGSGVLVLTPEHVDMIQVVLDDVDGGKQGPKPIIC
ncbi:MAG: hypothetical protein GY803_08110 [Chloroflexi bacterium]|nr:hypothetical protein [Chloroflexota bacterium]